MSNVMRNSSVSAHFAVRSSHSGHARLSSNNSSPWSPCLTLEMPGLIEADLHTTERQSADLCRLQISFFLSIYILCKKVDTFHLNNKLRCRVTGSHVYLKSLRWRENQNKILPVSPLATSTWTLMSLIMLYKRDLLGAMALRSAN